MNAFRVRYIDYIPLISSVKPLIRVSKFLEVEA